MRTRTVNIISLCTLILFFSSSKIFIVTLHSQTNDALQTQQEQKETSTQIEKMTNTKDNKIQMNERNIAESEEIKSEPAMKDKDPAGTVPVDENELSDLDNAEDDSVAEGSSLFSTVKQGGSLMIFLVLLGIISLTIIIERLLFFTRNKVWSNTDIEHYLRDRADNSSAGYHEDMEDELRAEFQLYANNLERGMSLLSGIGNLSPIIGFLGTVIGMISAFASIAAATTVNAKVVAVGIQIALVTTAGGLIVAAPSLGFFYLFMHIIQNRYTRSEEIISLICKDLPRLSSQLNLNKEDA